jgi:hypothetical protein
LQFHQAYFFPIYNNPVFLLRKLCSKYWWDWLFLERWFLKIIFWVLVRIWFFHTNTNGVGLHEIRYELLIFSHEWVDRCVRFLFLSWSFFRKYFSYYKNTRKEINFLFKYYFITHQNQE